MNKRAVTHLLAVTTISIWALGFPLTKIAISHFSPGALGLLRCAIATLVLLAAGKLSGTLRLPRRRQDLLWFLLAGATGFGVYVLLFNTGIQTLTAATSSIIISTTPIFTAILAAKVYQEKIKPLGWAMICLAFGGVVILLLWDGVFSVNLGLIWTVGAALLFSVYNLVSRKLSEAGYSAVEITFYGFAWSTLILSFYAFDSVAEITSAHLPELLSMVYLGVFPSATAYLLWAAALGRTEHTSAVTNYLFVTPLLSTVMGFLLLGEVPNPGTALGGAIIIASLIVFQKKAPPAKKTDTDEE